jgi:hypothetical protein
MLGPLARPAQAAALAAPPAQAARSYPRDSHAACTTRMPVTPYCHGARSIESILPIPGGWMAGLFGDPRRRVSPPTPPNQAGDGKLEKRARAAARARPVIPIEPQLEDGTEALKTAVSFSPQRTLAL